MSNSKCADVMRTFAYVFKSLEEDKGSMVIIFNNYKQSRDSVDASKFHKTLMGIVDLAKKDGLGELTMFKSPKNHIVGMNCGKVIRAVFNFDLDENKMEFSEGDEIGNPSRTYEFN